ncbi:MAG: helix-turn-helix domain-containing protein [Spirochaetales bacterium]|nr:helix-turn-helix domain-containing protein [Spirochaetales bacterium]
MESIGEKLRLSREEKGFSIDRVARDTNVARKYLEALENEDFNIFPGEPYLVGFLRIYSEYLGLEPQAIINLYKNFRIQEQPVPIDELLNKKDPKPFIIGAVISVGVILLGLLIYLIVPVIGKAAEKAKIRREQSIDIDKLMAFSGPGMLEEFSEDQGIRFANGDGENTLVVRAVNRDGTVELSLPDGPVILGINQEKTFTLKGSSGKTFSVLVSDVFTSRNSVSLYVNRIDTIAARTVPEDTVEGPETADVTDGQAQPETAATPTTVAPQTGTAAGTQAQNTAGTQATATQPAAATDTTTDTSGTVGTTATVTATASAADATATGPTEIFSGRQRPVINILVKDRPLPFSFKVEFDEDCMFRYQIDGTEESVQAFYESGETLRLSPRRKITFWASNAGSFNLYVDNRAVQVGQNGEVVAREISWNENENKEYVLELYSQD